MRLRTVAADRLALALAQPQMIDDPGTEQEHEQRARHHRPAGAEGDVAEDVEEAAEDSETGDGVGKLDQPVKHSICPVARLGCAVLPGKHRGNALIVVFIRKPSKSWSRSRREAANRRAETACGQPAQFTPLPARRPAT